MVDSGFDVNFVCKKLGSLIKILLRADLSDSVPILSILIKSGLELRNMNEKQFKFLAH